MFGKVVMAASLAATLALPAIAEARVGFGGGFRSFGPVGVARPGFGRVGYVRRGANFGRPFVPPFNYGVGMYGLNYGISCWRSRPTPFGWRQVWVCGYPHYGLPYWGYYPDWY